MPPARPTRCATCSITEAGSLARQHHDFPLIQVNWSCFGTASVIGWTGQGQIEDLFEMTNQPGTYALVLASQKAGCLRIGRLGNLTLQPGFYFYVGSAFGPGGLSARIKHHRQISDRPHWHVDYLRAVCDLVEVWFTTGATRREHAWAKAVARVPGAGVPLPGFGSSDCNCEAHLFRFERLPSVRAFRQQVKTLVLRTRLGSAPPRIG